MPLQSTWFRGNNRLQLCLDVDASHVRKGDRGDHVTLIHGALGVIDNLQVPQGEKATQTYGEGTANAVLHYKQKRSIINRSYQSHADNIVGRMTIGVLDAEMLLLERKRSSLLLSCGINVNPPKGVIISQSHPLPASWAKQVVAAFKPGVVNLPSPKHVSTEALVSFLRRAIAEANGGLLILAVGHGITNSDYPNQGGFDLADQAQMRIGGKGSNVDPKTFVDVFYEDKPPKGSPVPFSDKENDERTHAAGSEKRLKDFAIYKDLCQAFVDGKLAGVVLLTCRVGNSTEFLQKVASQWNTRIIAYRDWVIYKGGFTHKRVRAVLQRDVNAENSAHPGTNTPFAEVMFPLSLTDMIVVNP